MNRALALSTNQTFRLKSYSEERLVASVESNLDALERILDYNRAHGLGFFRIGSQLIPFASHPVCRFDWKRHFQARLSALGRRVAQDGMRLSMHPDQFTLINSPSADIFERSQRELAYHAALLDAMGLEDSHKIQIHVGGVYGDKAASMRRFVDRYSQLAKAVRRRLVVENDDRLFSLDDVLRIHADTGAPILFDTFHHEVLADGRSLLKALQDAAKTWRPHDGPPMIDYSSQDPAAARRGNHSPTLDPAHFSTFLRSKGTWDGDVMLEIKDKDASALKAKALLVPVAA